MCIRDRAWAAPFGHDAFHNHCSNHEHNCTSTCVKYVKKKLEAQQSLHANRVPSCRFWFFRIKRMRVQGREKAVRRRGKPLVTTPGIEGNDDRNQQCRCQVKRRQPFRSTSNGESSLQPQQCGLPVLDVSAFIYTLGWYYIKIPDSFFSLS